MIKATIKTNQMKGCLLLLKVESTQKPCLSKRPSISMNLLVCEFNPHRQTWYQKFIRTYLRLWLAGRAKTGWHSNTVIRWYRNLLSLSFVMVICLA